MGMKNPTKPQQMEDPEIDPQEMLEASSDVTSPKTPADVPAGLEAATEWDTPVGSSGEVAPKVGLDDEESVGTQLVLDGVEEAEREQRIAAAEGE